MTIKEIIEQYRCMKKEKYLIATLDNTIIDLLDYLEKIENKKEDEKDIDIKYFMCPACGCEYDRRGLMTEGNMGKNGKE